MSDLIVCITGERYTKKFEAAIRRELEELKPVLVLVGDCSGVDTSAQKVCKELGIDCEVFKADWNQFGKRAGYLRNKTMIDRQPGIVLAFHSNIGVSLGTSMTLKLAESSKLKTKLISEY